MLGRVAQGWSEVTNAEPGQGALHAVHKPRAFLDQALALPIGPLGVLFSDRRNAHHAAMAPFAPAATPGTRASAIRCRADRSLPGDVPAIPRHSRDGSRAPPPTRLKPTRQPEAVAAGFEGNRNPRDCAASPDGLIPPAMQYGK